MIKDKVILIGRLVNAPLFAKSGRKEICKLLIRSTSMGEKVSNHDVMAFGRQARLCNEYLHKGDLCCIEGSIDARTYECDGKTEQYQCIIAESVTFLSKPKTKTEPKPKTAPKTESKADLKVEPKPVPKTEPKPKTKKES